MADNVTTLFGTAEPPPAKPKSSHQAAPPPADDGQDALGAAALLMGLLADLAVLKGFMQSQHGLNQLVGEFQRHQCEANELQHRRNAVLAELPAQFTELVGLVDQLAATIAGLETRLSAIADSDKK